MTDAKNSEEAGNRHGGQGTAVIGDTGPAADLEPNFDIFKLHAASVILVLEKAGVETKACKECGYNDWPYVYTPDREEGTIPRVSSLGLSAQGAVTFTPSNHLPMVYLVCKNCGSIRMFSAYPIIEKIRKWGVVIDESSARLP